MADFNAAAVRFGKPGILRIASTTATEPTAQDDAWPVGWYTLGYTDEGSSFNYEISTDDVTVAEELDVLARVTSGRNASVEVALAEMTYRNLQIAFNGGIIPSGSLGVDWTFEPPDLGNEQRIMLGWDANPDTANNDLRIIFRQCLQGGSVTLENRKGATKQTISTTFQLEKPLNGSKLLKIFGAATLNPA
jgi:hypothetical protein